MDAVFKARDVYRVWHEEFFVKEKLLPASHVKIKMFCSDLAELGYSYHTVVGYVSYYFHYHIPVSLTSTF